MTDLMTEADVRIIASEKNWIEGEAIRQLKTTAKLPGMVRAVGLPDLHPGRGHPVGAAFVARGWIYPQLVGNDIGCGMGLWQTDLTRGKLKLTKWMDRLDGLEEGWDGDTVDWLEQRGIKACGCEHALGTIGGGNHFAELQMVEEINDPQAFARLDLNKESLYLLVHSGSRGLGEVILRQHVDVYAAAGLQEDTEAATVYLERHDYAVRWAQANRALIAQRFLKALRTEGKTVLDVNHNTVTPIQVSAQRYWVHRKGATPTTAGPVIIPGSRGDFSYLVEPAGEQEANGWSVAHGAGRKWARADAKGRLSHKFRVEDFAKTPLGSMVICEDRDLIYEEAPQAYKNIDIVVRDLVDAGLVRVLAVLRPLITYKTRRRS